jgi:hypothetical protein
VSTILSKVIVEMALVWRMKKDSQFTLRIPTELREDLQEIADTEGRSLAQVCDAFLRAGSEGYKKQGFKYLQKFLTKKG